MVSNPLLRGKSRGLKSVKNLLRRSAPLISANAQFANGLIDFNIDPLHLFEQNRTVRHAASYLNTVAATGLFSVTSLDQFYDVLSSADLCRNKQLLYYLASLYLQLNESDRVNQLLMSAGAVSGDITWFAALMIYARENGFELPVQSTADQRCLDFLQQRYQDSASLFIDVFQSGDTVSIIGNAPGDEFEFNTDVHKTICFNDYKKNPRIKSLPAIHVVTPSWDCAQADEEPRLFITGNNIFHRRSRVWRRFDDCPDYLSVSCFPKELWSGLYLQLKAPPSAGLLMMHCLADSGLPDGLSVLVAGFSDFQSPINHSYDRVPASSRHNWNDELLQRKESLRRIQEKTIAIKQVA